MDKISEMLTKIRNAQMAEHKEVLIKFSKLKFALANIFAKEGFIKSISKDKDKDDRDLIKIVLKYYQISNTEKVPAIKGIRRISKLGQRIYIKNKDIRSVKSEFGIAVISTSRGIVTGEEAKKLGLGGEYICEVW